MVSVYDVIDFIIINYPYGKLHKIKLFKLLYLCQAWYLAYNKGKPLFYEQFEAWISGPVIPELNKIFYYDLAIYSVPKGDASKLNEYQKIFLKDMLQKYEDKTDSWLILKLQKDEAWKMARKGYNSLQYCTNIIDINSIYYYYKNKDIEKELENE